MTIPVDDESRTNPVEDPPSRPRRPMSKSLGAVLYLQREVERNA